MILLDWCWRCLVWRHISSLPHSSLWSGSGEICIRLVLVLEGYRSQRDFLIYMVCFQITFFAGTCINSLLNKLLKLWFREPRPVSRLHIHEEYGMPSNHSQFVSFFTIYATLFILLRLNHIPQQNALPFERASRALLVLSCWLMAGLVSIGRTYLLYHTAEQVLYGIVAGVVFGIVWFVVTHLVLAQYFAYIVSWRFSEFFMLRDTTLIPNILWFEYRVTRQEARARSRKLTRMKSQ